ncbi:BspA family leucine-rich repeat surface protein [Limosilactobacillus reuteri]|uniref:MBG domain-containing protein n=1 Tax=Limosilactobacillus reuteri TaxID=1598 RepID=UPI001E525732|nr:MBG domain-containing protein [Limosilactobacillus reuteri]MCC4324316.1 BspA family leucine-rich repeat surface protein [Limosilactobacillus reuteri]MCC4334367.1 BspA family leucine-rich repeat surface protein [Limosilactobacillus reuteri]
MGKNNPLRSMTPKNKNYKLYKAKKQWITACATFMLAFGATAVVNASVQADTTTPATTQASGSTTTESAQLQSSAAETAQNTNETKRNVVANTTDTSKTGEQKTTTAQDTENSSSASSANKINSEEENKNAFLALNVNTADNATTTQALQENTIAAATATTPTTNGGYDSATWGTLDTSKWTGQTATFDGNNYYQLTGYTGDQTHIIVPNEADFEQAGKSTNNLQVSISNDLIKSWQNAATIAFSKTDDKKIKLASNNLNNTFQKNTTLTDLDANSLDTSSVISMQSTFEGASNLSALTGISDWNVQKVTNMTRIFNQVTKVPDLSPLSNWKTDSLQNLNTAFANNSFTNLQGLENWNVSHVTDMNSTFMGDTILNDLNALVKWDISNVTNLSMMFNRDSNLVTLTGLENWNTSKVTNLNATFANEGSLVDASAIANWNTSNVTNMSVLFAGSNAQYVDFSNWDFSKVTSASNVIKNTQSVIYLGNNSTLTADKLNTLGIANGGFTQPIILASGNLYTLLSNKNNNTHNITINNADSGQSTTISFPVVYDAAGASNMTDAINSYKDMVDQKLEDYVTEHNYVLKRVSTAPVDDVTGHNNHLVNYATATYQVVTIPADQKKEIQIRDKTVYKGNSLTAKDLVINSADFPAGTTFEFIDNSEPNWNQLGTYDVKVIATYPVSVNGQQYTAVTTPATAKVTVTDQMQFTITYWDDTENKEIVQFDIKNAGNGAYDNQLSFPKGVNTHNYQSVSVSGVPAGADFAGDFWRPFTDQSCNWTIPNYKWDSAAAPSLFNANVVVHLIHKTQDVTNTAPAAQETRTVTVNYVKTKVNEDGTYTEDGNAFASAVLDVYYTRQATKDLATGDTTYGPWQWNTKKGDSSTPGYHVVSGTWTNLPQKWANVTADVPTLTGYTAYTGGPASNTNKIPANQFVFPTWNGSDGSTSDNSKGSSAYTTAVSLYEAQPVHTIFYVPNKTEARTITAKFVIAGGDKNGDSFRPDAQVQVFYAQTGTIDPATNKVVYSGNWQWDQNEGDTANPGFHVISGSWNLPKSNQPFSVNVPDAGNDYVVATIQLQGIYATNTFASPNFNPGTVFTNATDPTWYVRNDLTTYYVPKSLVEKTINRVINMIGIDKSINGSALVKPSTTTQSATITRPVKVNADDSGVTFDGFDGSGWTTGKWGRYNNIPVPNNYTKVIKQIVTHPDGTTTETTLDIPNWRPIPAQTVTIATLPTVINITYTATATAFLAGTNESTYTGSPITLDDLNDGNGDNPIYVGVTGPTGGLYTLQAGDVEFSSDNGQNWTTEMPTNAGTYELRWSEQGKQNIIKEFGNNSIKWVDAQGNSTFTSTATYIINPKPITNVTVSGDQSKTYDGQQASVDGAGLTISGTGTIAGSTLTAKGLVASDFDWYTFNGNKLNAIPTDVGSYEARLNSTGLKNLQTINSNYSFSTASGTIKYTIDKAKAIATIGGSYERDYNGQPINGTSIYNQITWAGRDISNSKDFNLNHSITANDYAWYTKSGDQYVKFQGQPVNAGVYYLILNNDYITTLDKENPNYDISKVEGAFVYTINQAQAGSVTFNANVQKTYDGSAVLNNASFNTAPSIVIKGADGKPLAGLNNYTFQSGDFEFIDSTGKTVLVTINNNGQISGPINAGTYTIRLTQAGLKRIEQANPNINFANVKLDDTGSGTLTISQYVPNLNLSGNGSKIYDGQIVTSTELIKQDRDNTITIKLTVPKQGGGTTEVTYAFNPKMDYTGDYDWYSNGAKINAPKNAGTYVIKLKADQVKTILEDLVSRDSNYSYLKGNLDFNNAQITGQASYTINKKPLTVYLDGESSAVYTGSGAEMPLQDLINHLEAHGLVNGETLNTDTFDKADFQWYVKNADGTYSVFTGKDAQGNTVQTPINVGTYYIGILPETSTNSGIDTLQRDNTNYDVTIDYSKYYQFDITPAKGTITLSGGQTDTYNGQAHNITGYTLTISGVGLPSGQTVTLKDGDLEYYVDGQWTTSVPKNAGTYQVRLSDSALTELERSYTNFSWTSDNVTNNAQEYVINPTQVQVSFTGEPKHVIYNGQGVSVDYGSDAMKGYFNMTGLVNGDKLIYPSLSSDQFEWVDSAGNVMTTVPVNVGTYTLRLKTTSDMDKLNSNYNFVFAKDSAGNDINGWQWIIDKATATITFTTGNQNTPWTGQPTILNPDNFAVTISTNNGRTLTASGLEASDFQFYDQSGQAISTPTAVGNYIIKLKQSGLDKIEKDTANYTWINNANGSYEITKAQVSIKLNGESSMTYNGQAASFPVNSDGSVKGITVTLSNGKTYTLKPGDLAFVNGNGEFIDAPVNAGDYKVTLSQVGLNNINKIDGENYQYTLDENDKTANFTIEKADATIVLNGTGTHVYNGQAASTNEGSYTIQLPGQTASTNVNAANLVFVDGAPTNVGTYSIALSDAYKKQLQDIYGNNYNLTFTNGSFTVTPKTVNLILNGYSSQIYNGQPAKVSNISNLTLTWGDHTTTTAPGDVKFTLSADDLEVVNKNGQTPTAANSASQENNPYYVQLKNSILNQLNDQNKNYKFVIGDTYARYTIYAKKSNVTFTGKQFANYGSNPMPAIDPSNYTLTWTDIDGHSHNIEITADDLTVEVPSGVPTDKNGLPLNAGQYVVKVKQSVIDNFNAQHPDYKLSNDPNTNAWYVVKHRQVSFTINGTPSSTYNGQAVSLKDGNYSISFGPISGNQNSGVLSGDQNAFNSIKWYASDFEFVNGAPTTAGTYQVCLSSAGLKKLQEFANGATGSNYDFSSDVTVDNGQFTASSVTANYTVNKNELTVSLTNKDDKVPSSVIGKYDLSAGNYTLTITPTETIYGTDGKPLTLTYNLKDTDLAYKNGTPSNIGTYDVQLTAAAISDLEQKFGTENYTYKLSPSATHEITKGTGMITLSGGQTETYTGQPAVLKHDKYFVTVTTNIYSDSSYLNAGDMQFLVFYTKNADGSYTQLTNKPTDVGTYYVGLNEYMIKKIEDATGNNGDNYNWSQNYATYVITAAKGTASGSYTNSSTYNARPIGKQDITVNVDYPGAKSNTYTLQEGDYEYVNEAGSAVVDPTDAGTYTIRLTTAGENHIKQLGNLIDAQGNITKQNVNWTVNFVGSYTINAVRMTVTVNGTQDETYNGNAKTINIGGPNGVNVTISADGLTVPTIPTTGVNALTADDFTIKDAQGQVVTDPTNAGAYKVYLNSKGLEKLGKLSTNFIVPESLEQSANLIIARQDVNITEGSAGKTFDAQSAALTEEQFAQYKKAITDAGYSVDGLTIDGIDWWFDDTVDYGTQGNQTNPIKDIGTYNLRLNAKGQKELDNANPNYKLKVGDFQYTIYPEVVHIEVDGTQNADWDNQGVAIDPTKFVPKFVVYGGKNGDQLITNPVRDDGQPLTLPAGVQLVPSDYEFVDDNGNVITSFKRQDGTTSTNPFKVGTYHVRLTENGWKKLATQSTDNVKYQYDNSTGTLNINQITPEIKLNGANWKTYDGQPVSFDELVSKDPTTNQLVIYVGVSADGHTINLPLDPGTYDWNSNGQLLKVAPSQVGTYTITLNKDKVIAYLNNWMANNSDYQGAMKILADNIGGSALFEIKARNITKLEADPASGSQTYTGQAVQIDLSDIVGSLKATDSDGKVWKLNTDTLTLDDYTITDSNGKIVTGFPVNVGTYTFKINEKGIATLASANPNFTIPNEINGYSYTYTINPAEASGELAGTNSGVYTGKPITTAQVNSNGQIVVTVDYPGVAISNKTYTLKDGDYTWSTGNGSAPTDAGKYTIALTKDGIANIENYIRGLAGTGQDNKSNVVFAENAITGSATFEIVPKSISDVTISGKDQEKTYDGQPASLDVKDLTINANDLVTDNPLSMKGITASDFDWYDDKGNKLDTVPNDAGVYEARLKSSALQTLQADNPNYSFNTANGTIKYTINQKAATDTLVGNGNKVYNGQETTVSDVLNSITWTPSDLVDGQSLDLADLTEADYAWYTKNADGTYTEMSGLPTNAGTYYLKLKDSSIAKIQTANPNYSFAADAISGEYTYVIKQAPAGGVLTGANSRAYNGQATTTAEVNSNGQIEVTVSFPGVTDANKTYLLKDGDYTWNTLDGSAPTNVGEYTIILTNDGISNIKNYIIGLAGRGQNDLPNVAFADDAFTGSASYTINKAEATVTISGKVEQTYNGQVLDDSTIYGQIVWSAHDTTNDKSFTLTHDISTSDYSWYTKNGDQYVKFTGQPVNAGTYYLIFNKDYTDKLNQENPNYDFTSVNGAFTYVVNKATATLNIAGSQSTDYNGQPVTIDYSNFPLSITTNNGVTVDLPAGVSLGADDVIITNAAGQVVAQPTAIGTYTITLTDNGLKKFASQTDNYDWTTAGSATLSITRNANVSVTLSGNEKVVYAGAVAVINPADFKITLGNGLTYELQAGDLQFVNTAAGANTNVGTYEVELSDQGRANIAKVQADNYGYDFSKAGLGTVTITKATPSAALSGDAEKSYDGMPISGYTPVVTITAPGNNSVNLTAGDYEWVKDGQIYPTAPSDAGTYTVQLTQSGIAKVKAVNVANLDWSNVQITGSGSYTINQANALITLPATSTQTITWTGNPATIDPANFIPEITTNNPNEKTIALPSTLQLTASDYEFLQDGKVISTPSEVGTYQVRLTQAGWQKVQNAIAGNNNYTWNYQGKGNYHIEKAAAGIEIIANGADSMIYNGKPATLNVDDYTLKITTNNGQTIIVPLAAGDLTFSDGETPVNAGSYGVTLTQAALNKIKADYSNYDWRNPVAGTYTINKAAADVTTSGSYDVVYNGHTPTINLAEISNKIATNNGVILIAPNLSADDYEWVDENGQAIANPVNVGTYYLKLKDTSQSKIASNDNYTWSFTGLATVTVTKANAEISFSGSQESPYTGSMVTLDPSQFAVKLSNGQTYQLTAKDIQVIGDPVNVGTYQVELSPAGIDAIKATDSNYNYQYDGSHGLLTIVPAPATATISGSQTTRDLELDPSRYTVEVNGQTITGLTANDFVFSQNGQPAQLTAAGTYEVDLSWDAINKIRQANPNYKLDFSSTATFTLENSSQTINYVDAKGNVIGSASVGGKLKGSEVDFTPEFPAGWVASEPSGVPSEIKLENETTVIQVEHGITTVDHTKPVPVGEKTPTGELINGAHENDLNQTITRTINVTMPDGKTQAITQTAKLYRDASYDDVTGEVSYGQWSTTSWNEFIPAAIKGYTPSESAVPAVEVTAGQKDETINITYLANEQSGVISYRDETGKEIGTTPISGKTGETIAIKPEAPAGWQLVPGQQLPQTVTATADGIPTITVKVEHRTIVVTPETPAADTPTGKVPGDPSKNYQTMEQLTVTPTRTIKVKYPDGQEQSIVQKVTFTRNAIFDEVTGEIKYTDWLAQGSSQWASYQPVEVPGYVSQPKVVPAMIVNADTPAETVTITYNKIPVPQVGQEIISYQDANGQVIHTQTVTGEENTNISFTPEVPENWQPVSELPKSVKIAGRTTVIVIEPMMVPVQEQQTVTRTIIEHLPSGDKQIVQTVHLTGTGTKNLVTGQVTDVKWDSGKFNAYTPVVVPGYTADMSIVSEVNVTASTGDSVVEINYLPNEQTGMIIYRDESGRDISQTTLQGKTGETIAVNLAVPAGWELVPNQSIPATVMAGPDGIPDVVVLIKHQTITVRPGQTAPSGQVPGNPSATYEKMESLIKEVTRTITVKLPDGQRQVITQAVKFTRTATFDEVTGRVAYSSWQVEGSDEWPAYTVPAIKGYTASQASIPAKIVVPDDEDQNIEIEYTKDHQPSEPDQPVTPSVPAQPAMPTKDDQLVSNNQSQIKVTDKVTSPVSNQHFVSRQLSPASNSDKTQDKLLPQTGNSQLGKRAAALGFAFATLAGIFGLASLKRKKRDN